SFSRIYRIENRTHRAHTGSIVDWSAVSGDFQISDRGSAQVTTYVGTYSQFSNAAAARTECWENSACKRGEKQVKKKKKRRKKKNREVSALPVTRRTHQGPLPLLGNRPCGPRPEASGRSRGWYREEGSANPAPPPSPSGGLGLAGHSASRPL
ncbi:hypothetical protein X777_06282, partial [Ooceraea biroi]